MTMEQINSRLEELKEEKTKIKGLETEVYARIVGYYRSVRNWNKGKKEEYGERINYSEIDSDRPSIADSISLMSAGLTVVEDETTNQRQLSFSSSLSPSSYLYFYRKTCPNCPPVAGWLGDCGIEGRKIDVDRESGIHEAQRYDITAAPTVVFLDAGGNEISRGSTVASLDSQVNVAALTGA